MIRGGNEKKGLSFSSAVAKCFFLFERGSGSEYGVQSSGKNAPAAEASFSALDGSGRGDESMQFKLCLLFPT